MLPPLPFPMGDSGPHLSLVFAALGVLAGILRMREWSVQPEPAHLGMLAYGCVLAASVSLAAFYSGPVIAAASFARVMLLSISLYAFFYAAYGPGRGGTSKALRTVYAAGVLSAFFACIDFYFQFPAPAGFGAQYVWMESGVYRRAQGVFYEASTLGNLCVFFLVMTAAGLMQSSKDLPISRPALFVGIVVFAPALMLSFSRASLINLVIAIISLLCLERYRLRGIRLVLVPVSALAAGGIAAYYFFPRFTSVYWERMNASITYLFAATEGVLSGRVESWRTLSNFLLENPWYGLFGIGYKTLPYSDFVGRTVVADNAYLSALVETGIVGLAAMLLFNLAILRIAYLAARHPDPRAVFFGTCVFCFWIGQTVQMMSGDLLTYWRVLPVYLWTLGMAARYSSEPSSARPIQ
jgi:O-antigen ligase